MYLVAALKILYNSEFSHERAAAKYTHLPNLTDIPTSNRELHLFHTVHVPIISMLSKKNAFPGTTHMTYINSYMFRHLRATLSVLLQQRCKG
jgi:hypothetical protein